MKCKLRLGLWMLMLCLCSFASAQTDSLTDKQRINPAAKEELNQGVQDYKQSRYESAIQHFTEATKLAPQFVPAHLYLATALAQQYVPGVDTPENLKFADDATESYKQVLILDPKNVTALKGLAYLELNMKRFEEAKSYYRQASQLYPLDPEPFYSVGVIDWTECYKRRMDERSKWELSQDDPPSTTQRFCPKLRADNLPLIEDGMQALKKAIELRPDYDDAMVYLNLLFRERADIQCGDEAARSDDEAQANAWTNKAMAVRKRKIEKVSQNQKAPQNQ